MPTAANNNEIRDDVVQPFMIAGAEVRGQFVRLGTSLDTILSGHQYPENVAKLLGELLVMAVMLGSTLKMDGMISLQVQGDGPLNFLTADYLSSGHIRGYGRLRMAADDPAFPRDTLNPKELFGKGFVVITLEHSTSTERYQGIVELVGESLSECLVEYFRQSEQLDARLALAVERHADQWKAAGIMIQRIAQTGGNAPSLRLVDDTSSEKVEDPLCRAAILLATVQPKELNDPALSPSVVLYRLFHEDGILIYTARPIEAKCRCSREKMQSALDSLSTDALEELKVEGVIAMKCEFCGREEKF